MSLLTTTERSAPLTDIPPAAGVHVTDLTRRYGRNTVLHGISFDVPEGSVCTLLGASGSGKTTTLRLLAGLDRPDGGEIRISGKRVAGDRFLIPAEKREVGLLFQAYALWPHMSVFDQIAYPLKVRRMSKSELTAKVTAAADMVGLTPLLDRLPSQLSGGQQQRVGLARALVFGPRLLLLDEPLSGLDAALRRQTRLELEQLQARVNVTTIYVTHDQEEAMSVSDLVVVMNEGRIVEMAPPNDIYDRPSSVFVASFVGGSNLLHGEVAGVEGDRATVRLSDGSTVTGVARGALRSGGPAVVAVKPVDVVVEPDVGGGTNVLTGKVDAATYLGAQIELQMSVSGNEVRAIVPRWSGLSAGDPIRVLLQPERTTVLPPDAEPDEENA
ncbi:MAG TPA: ABC transporter ATP-binding protein [Micromonosporaceae bacterium]